MRSESKDLAISVNFQGTIHTEMEGDCNVTLRRLAKPQPDYHTLINNGVPWTDVDFPFGTNVDYRSWNVVARKNYSLFGQFGARPEDTDQGALGNLWLVAAAAAAAEHPGLKLRVYS